MPDKQMPIQWRLKQTDRLTSIPWSLFSDKSEARAKKNHDQTLDRLAQRGGMSCYEAVCLICDLDISWTVRTLISEEYEAYMILKRMIEIYEETTISCLNARITKA